VPYLYVLIVDALGYLLEFAYLQGWLLGMSFLDGSKMVNNHFVNESLLFV
jgi:hypothetical protein